MAQVTSSDVFAFGAKGQSAPDSLTVGNGSVWAEYGNGADSTGAKGGSTLVQYATDGTVQNTYALTGSVDGLKIDPGTGIVWALQNQDGNSTLTLINPATGAVSAPLSPAAASDMRGYDDVAFVGNKVYESYTNPNGSGDAVLQQLTNGEVPFGPLAYTTILADGATGTNVAAGQTQAIPLNDPDSLKSTPDGSLVQTSGADNTFTLIHNPGAANQTQSFYQLANLPAGSSLDDVVVPGSTSGTLYIANLGANQVLKDTLAGLGPNVALASVGTEIVEVDLTTGAQTALITGLQASHGLAFVPDATATTPVVQSEKIVAVGGEVGGTQPDSLTMGRDGSLWVEYGNGADSTGKGGTSTIAHYSPAGDVLNTYTLPGSIDGLKVDPTTNQVWALENQDANARLILIDPATNQVGPELSYAPPYVYGDASARGYDDVAFDGNRVYLSYTNPKNVGDSVVQKLDNGTNPVGALKATSILRLGDTGTNLVNGQVNQPLPVNDPDSLKTLSDGSLILTSDHDRSYTIVAKPGTAQQSEGFVTLPAGSTGLDDAVVPSSTSGTFYVANQGGNDVIAAKVTGLNTHDLYASVGSDNAVVQIDTKTGTVTPVITGLGAPHGLLFVADAAGTPATTSPPAMPAYDSLAVGSAGMLAQHMLCLPPVTSASDVTALLAGLGSATAMVVPNTPAHVGALMSLANFETTGHLVAVTSVA